MKSVLLLRIHADVIVVAVEHRRLGKIGQFATQPLLDQAAELDHAIVVDHELQARFYPRYPITRAEPPYVDDCAEHFEGVFARNENAQMTCEPRGRGLAAAYAHCESVRAFKRGADQRDAIDLRSVASGGASRNRDL